MLLAGGSLQLSCNNAEPLRALSILQNAAQHQLIYLLILQTDLLELMGVI